MHKGELAPAALLLLGMLPPPQSRARGGSHPLRCHDPLLPGGRPRPPDPHRTSHDAPTEGGERHPRAGGSELAPIMPAALPINRGSARHMHPLQMRGSNPSGRSAFLGTILRFGAQGSRASPHWMPSSRICQSASLSVFASLPSGQGLTYCHRTGGARRRHGARGFASDGAAAT